MLSPRTFPRRHRRSTAQVGGCGKTHFALGAAADLVPRFADAVLLAQLAPLMDVALVPRAVAAALGVSGRSEQPILESLVAALSSHKLLVVLDNCERCSVRPQQRTTSAFSR
jgi:predicted ATPase